MKRFYCFFLCLCCFFHCLAYAEDDLSKTQVNEIIVCDNGLEMLGWDLEFIRHAQHSIDMAVCFFGGQIARELFREIEARLEICPQLKARILTTPMFLEPEDLELICHLEHTYPHNFHLTYTTTVGAICPDISGIDSHVKMCVVDGWYFSIGGTNLHDAQCSEGTYTPPIDRSKLHFTTSKMPAGMRDQDIVGRGPIAEQLRCTMCKLISLWDHYNKTKYLEKDPEKFQDNPLYFEVEEKPFVHTFECSDQLITLETSQIRYILSGPHQKKNAVTEEYVRLIEGAIKEIKIANLYLSPDDPILKALMDAVNRGVVLTCITNGISDISPGYACFFGWGNRMSYVPLFYGSTYHFWDYWSVKNKNPKNTRIYEYHVEDVLLHKKIMVVDEHIFVVGSYNLGMRSALSDYENIVVIDSPVAVQAANKVYARDLCYCREISLAEAVEWYFNPITAAIGEIQKRFGGLL